MIAYDQFETPHGTMLVTATDKGVAGVYFKGQKHFPKQRDWQRDAPWRKKKAARAAARGVSS